MTTPDYWIGVVSRAHVERGVEGGFMQLNHGRKAPLQKLRGGDYVVMYSPRTSYPDGDVLQAFTAIGIVVSGEIYQVEMSADFKPYRIDVRFLQCRETPIRPLIDRLTFIKNKEHWGSAFRFGHLQISSADFAVIARAMECESLDPEFSKEGQ